MSEVQCEVQKILDPDTPTVTVGERFALQCSGFLPDLDKATAAFRLDTKDKYLLKLLRFEKSSDSAFRLEVLSDQVGKHELQNLVVGDSLLSATIPKLSFEVRSVQDPQSPVQEPFGPFGPLGLSIPWIYWIGLVIVLSSLGLLISWRVHLRLQRRKLMKQILDSASAAPPESEVFQALRRLQRQFPVLMHPEQQVASEEAHQAVELLNQSYRLFLSRHFVLPAAVWSSSRTLRTLQKEHPSLAPESREMIRKTLRELDRAGQAQLRSRDLSQLAVWIRESSSDLARGSK